MRVGLLPGRRRVVGDIRWGPGTGERRDGDRWVLKMALFGKYGVPVRSALCLLSPSESQPQNQNAAWCSLAILEENGPHSGVRTGEIKLLAPSKE